MKTRSGCKYCDGGDKLTIDNMDIILLVDGENKTLDVEYLGDNGNVCEYQSINFCPMCGKEL